MKWLTIIFLVSTSAHALDWASQMHHIAPLMNESEEAITDSKDISCKTEEVKPYQYISPLPKTEPWRAYYKVPKLLTKDLYKVNDVCLEAKRMNAAQGVTKKYALIAQKTHLCDGGHRACLSTFKSVSDPCNNFVQDNFQVFHTRTFIGQYRQPGYEKILEEYGSMGPSLLVIDLETCSLMKTPAASKAIAEGMKPADAVKDSYFYTPPSMDGEKDEAGQYKFKSENDQVRFTAMREALVKNHPSLAPLAEGKKNDCYEEGKRTLPGIGDLETVKYGELEMKGAQAIRKLMDEQYIEQTGINPYAQTVNKK